MESKILYEVGIDIHRREVVEPSQRYHERPRDVHRDTFVHFLVRGHEHRPQTFIARKVRQPILKD